MAKHPSYKRDVISMGLGLSLNELSLSEFKAVYNFTEAVDNFVVTWYMAVELDMYRPLQLVSSIFLRYHVPKYYKVL